MLLMNWWMKKMLMFQEKKEVEYCRSFFRAQRKERRKTGKVQELEIGYSLGKRGFLTNQLKFLQMRMEGLEEKLLKKMF